MIDVNEDAFSSDGEENTDLIPIVVRHEVVEFWTHAKTGYSFVPRPESKSEAEIEKLGHGLALRKQYEYAFEIGKADRFLQFITAHINNDEDVAQDLKESQIKEHEDTYNLEKKRHEKK